MSEQQVPLTPHVFGRSIGFVCACLQAGREIAEEHEGNQSQSSHDEQCDHGQKQPASQTTNPFAVVPAQFFVALNYEAM